MLFWYLFTGISPFKAVFPYNIARKFNVFLHALCKAVQPGIISDDGRLDTVNSQHLSKISHTYDFDRKFMEKGAAYLPVLTVIDLINSN